MPFQELSKRKRKDVKVEDIQVRVCLFAFDLLYLNGEVWAYQSPFHGVTNLNVSSPYFGGRSVNGENSCESISRSYQGNLTSLNIPTGSRPMRSKHSWKKASRMGAKASWSKCWRVMPVTMSQADVV